MNLVLDQDENSYLMSLSILNTCLLDNIIIIIIITLFKCQCILALLC